ncbi:putative Protein kinase domain [Paratrimastix pyriformis]|uniref:non-specific serine/threonine protein kinase n=1 Tax=Paratrimastix pyriformis TaxID=342808 RepID=A0ABQ8UR19_9EUKA|nr:putative Protein kinase domain [Paratrimastix pyriformis]
MSLRAFVAIFRFRGSNPDQIPLVNPEDIVFVSEDDSSANPYVVSLKIPRTQGEMPRRYLKAVPEPLASDYLAAFEEGFVTNLCSPLPAPPSGALPAPPCSPAEPATAAPANPTLAAPGAAAAAAVVPSPAPPTAAITTGGESGGGSAYKALLFASEGVQLWNLAQSVQAGSTQLLLFDLVGGIYRHKPDPRLLAAAGPWSEPPLLVASDGRPLTRSCWVLGAGAFGVTFRVEDTRDHSEAALKATRPPQSADEKAFFNNESYIAGVVDHPNVLSTTGHTILIFIVIVTILRTATPLSTQTHFTTTCMAARADWFRRGYGGGGHLDSGLQLEPGGPELRCLVTPYCDGGDLDGVIRRHLCSPSAADRQERWLLLSDLIQGLAYLHGQPFRHNHHRVLHNDIKPANVLLRLQVDQKTGTERPMALLADLGLACVYTGGSLTYGLCRGTPGFMAPELFVMPGGVRPGNTPATDVYALGATLYCLYSQTDTAHRTEEQPTEAELRAAFAEVTAREQAARARGSKSGEDSLAELLVRMCSESPTARPSAERLLGALKALETDEEGEACRKAEEEARRKAAEEAVDANPASGPAPAPSGSLAALFGAPLQHTRTPFPWATAHPAFPPSTILLQPFVVTPLHPGDGGEGDAVWGFFAESWRKPGVTQPRPCFIAKVWNQALAARYATYRQSIQPPANRREEFLFHGTTSACGSQWRAQGTGCGRTDGTCALCGILHGDPRLHRALLWPRPRCLTLSRVTLICRCVVGRPYEADHDDQATSQWTHAPAGYDSVCVMPKGLKSGLNWAEYTIYGEDAILPMYAVVYHAPALPPGATAPCGCQGA